MNYTQATMLPFLHLGIRLRMSYQRDDGARTGFMAFLRHSTGIRGKDKRASKSLTPSLSASWEVKIVPCRVFKVISK